MKKIISVLLTLALVLSLVPAVFAADEPTFSLSADKTSVAPGETVTLTLSLDKDTVVDGAQFKIDFDKEAYEYVKKVPDTFDDTTNENVANVEGCVGATYLNTKPSKPTTWSAGKLDTFTFKAKEGANTSAATFKLTIESLKKYNPDDPANSIKVAHNVVGGELTIPVTGGSVTPEGYSVSIPETKTVTTGETVEIPITISGKDYNAYSVYISYYTDVLELQNNAVNNEGFRLSEEKYTDADYRPGSWITLVRYGDTAQPGEALRLTFTAKAQGTTDVTILRAHVDERANSISFNAPDATITNKTTAVTVSGYTVSLPDDFTRTDAEGTVIMEGKDLTFKPKDPNYDYTVTVTVGGGEATTVSPDENGIYTVANVTGNVVVSGTKTPKTFTVALGDDTSGDPTATYQTNYTFKLTPADGFAYKMAVTIGGKVYTGFAPEVNDDGTTTYTIPGADITGEIVINSNKQVKPLETYKVTFAGTGAGDATGENTVQEKADYTFTVNKKDGFEYTVTATMGGKDATITEGADNTYTIANVTGDLVITIERKSTLTMKVAVSEYVQMDNKTVFLVTVTGTPEEGKAYAYDGNVMYKTTAYGANAYSWLVIVAKGQEFTADTAKANITEASATAEEMAPSCDVNETKTVDINDAQLVYDIYSGKYGDFEKVTVKKFLCADVNSDKIVNSTDAVAVVKASE